MFLWVNVGSKKASTYENTFEDAGRRMTWFGGSISAGEAHHKLTAIEKNIASLR